MKNLFFLGFVGLFLLSSCCSNKKTCSILSFKNIKMVGFDSLERNDTINIYQYFGSTGFTQLVKTYSVVKVVYKEDGLVELETPEFSIDDNYEVEVTATGKKYRISSFAVEKIACGKCFMRTNNQYGYKLNGYKVNGRSQQYDGQIFIAK
jgi:hypothetical protein